MQPLNDISFETVLGERVEAMLNACTQCGRCVEVCPSVKPAGISDTRPEDIISGRSTLCAPAKVPTSRANGRRLAC